MLDTEHAHTVKNKKLGIGSAAETTAETWTINEAVFSCNIKAYRMEKRKTIFLESNEAARLYLLHLLFDESWNFSVTGFSVTSKKQRRTNFQA